MCASYELSHPCLPFMLFLFATRQIEGTSSAPRGFRDDAHDAHAESEADESADAPLLMVSEGFVVEFDLDEPQIPSVPDEKIGHTALRAQVAYVVEHPRIVYVHDAFEPLVLLRDVRVAFSSVRVDESAAPYDISALLVVGACGAFGEPAQRLRPACGEDADAFDAHVSSEDPFLLRIAARCRVGASDLRSQHLYCGKPMPSCCGVGCPAVLRRHQPQRLLKRTLHTTQTRMYGYHHHHGVRCTPIRT